MLSPVFWLSLVAVFLGLKWLADGMLFLAWVEVRRVSVAHAASGLVEPAPRRPDSNKKENAVAALDEAA